MRPLQTKDFILDTPQKPFELQPLGNRDWKKLLILSVNNGGNSNRNNMPVLSQIRLVQCQT